jgi:type IV pilus assembly protein PilO
MDKQAVINKLERLTLVQKILIVLLTLVFIGGGSWYFFFSPKFEKLGKLRENIASLEQTIAKYKVLAAKLPHLEEELAKRKKELVLARMLLPEDVQALERLLASFEKLGNEKEVEFLLFQPGPEEKHDFYATRRVQLRLQGAFHNLVQYFDSLVRLDRLVSLENLRLTPVKKKVAPGESFLMADSSILVYRALTPEELQEMAKQKTKKK